MLIATFTKYKFHDHPQIVGATASNKVHVNAAHVSAFMEIDDHEAARDRNGYHVYRSRGKYTELILTSRETIAVTETLDEVMAILNR